MKTTQSIFSFFCLMWNCPSCLFEGRLCYSCPSVLLLSFCATLFLFLLCYSFPPVLLFPLCATLVLLYYYCPSVFACGTHARNVRNVPKSEHVPGARTNVVRVQRKPGRCKKTHGAVLWDSPLPSLSPFRAAAARIVTETVALGWTGLLGFMRVFKCTYLLNGLS